MRSKCLVSKRVELSALELALKEHAMSHRYINQCAETNQHSKLQVLPELSLNSNPNLQSMLELNDDWVRLKQLTVCNEIFQP